MEDNTSMEPRGDLDEDIIIDTQKDLFPSTGHSDESVKMNNDPTFCWEMKRDDQLPYIVRNIPSL